jgi:magnesium transporter
MSGAQTEEVVRSAVPVPDLSALDLALTATADALKTSLQRFRPADIGRDLSRRPLDECCRILQVADDRRAGAILRAAHPAIAANILAKLDAPHAVRILSFMPTDHEVSILAHVSEEDRARIEAALDPEDKKTVDRILSHGENAVARLMTPKIWRAEHSVTAGEAMTILKQKGEDIEVAQNCYIVKEGKLVGVAALRELAVAKPETPLDDIMTRSPIAVSEDTERGDAAEIIQTHDFLSLPVIDKDGRLVGAVRVDDLLDAALSHIGAGLLNQGGVAGKIAAQLPYFQISILQVVRSRITWLVLLFVAETATGYVLRHFEDELAKVVALSFFVPLLIGTGGNAGSQTVSTVIRALALGEVQMRDVLRVLLKEVAAGIILGLLLGGIAFGRAMMWGVGYDLAACVAITIVIVCTWANTVGSLIPIGAQRLGIDPTVISGPLITTLVDASGLFIYLSVAAAMIKQLQGP